MKTVAGFLAGAALLVLSGPALAQQCIPIPSGETVAEVMLRDFGEHFLWRGQMKEGPVLEMYVNPQTGAWTQFFLIPEREMVCFAASGTGSELNPIPRKDGA